MGSENIDSETTRQLTRFQQNLAFLYLQILLVFSTLFFYVSGIGKNLAMIRQIETLERLGGKISVENSLCTVAGHYFECMWITYFRMVKLNTFVNVSIY